MTFWSCRMKTIKEFSETLNEAPKRDVWGKQYKKLQGEFKTLGQRLNLKLKDINKRWPKMTDSEKSNTVIQMVSMRKKLSDAWNTSTPTKGMYQKRAGD